MGGQGVHVCVSLSLPQRTRRDPSPHHPPVRSLAPVRSLVQTEPAVCSEPRSGMARPCHTDEGKSPRVCVRPKSGAWEKERSQSADAPTHPLFCLHGGACGIAGKGRRRTAAGACARRLARHGTSADGPGRSMKRKCGCCQVRFSKTHFQPAILAWLLFWWALPH